MSSSSDEGVRRVASNRRYENELFARSQSPAGSDADERAGHRTRRDASTTSQQSDEPDAPAKAKGTKRVLPRFAGDGLSDDEGANPFDDDSFWDTAAPAEETRRRAGSAAAAGPSTSKRTNADMDDDDVDIDAVFGGKKDDDNIDKVAKKRRTARKLDEDLLMGPNGFPALIPEVLKFKPKGKGHEFEDLGRLMSTYQLWCHRMYPKLNLTDCLKQIEKVCHKRVMISAMRQWRDEWKHGKKRIDEAERALEQGELEAKMRSADGNDDGAHEDSQPGPSTSTFTMLEGDDDLWADEDAVLRDLEREAAEARTSSSTAAAAASKQTQNSKIHDDDAFDEDEEAAIREMEREREREQADYDEEEALLREFDSYSAGTAPVMSASTSKASEQASASKATPTARDEFDDMFANDDDDFAPEHLDQLAQSKILNTKSASPVKQVADKGHAQEEEEGDFWAAEEQVLRELEMNG